ncbi:MAG TPA: SRPBCC domain-containing protein [Gaiellaceae bacterium]
MHIEGERRFAAPPERVYEALTDPERLGGAFSAIERVDAEGDDWVVLVRPPVPGGFRLKFSVRLEELREPEHARLRAWGKSLAGRISVDSSFDLEPDGTGTLMRWSAEVDAAGLFSGLGSQALGPVAKQQADRALARLEPQPA